MATVQTYTKAGVDAKFNSRSNMTIVHSGGGTPDIAAFPDAKTGDVIERSGDGARWSVLARNLNPIEGRVVSVAGKSGAVKLGPSDVGAAPTTHTHTKSQITDLNASTTATANSIAQRDSSGRLVVGTPATTTHATTKAYVDSEVTDAKKWSNLTGVPSTFAPSNHTHTVANITDLTLASAATANTTPVRDSAGRFEVANPSSSGQVANKSYVDSAVSSGTTWANTSGKPTTFPPSSHTHTKAQISDLNASTAAGANTIAQRDANGRLTVATPSTDSNAATKKYVDDTVTAGATWSSLAGKPSTFAPSSHNHTVANITDLTLAIPATPSTTPLRGTDGTITTADPTASAHAATKKYVDAQVLSGATWSSLSGKPSTFPPSSHTHTTAQISDLTLSTTATANTVVQRDSSGRATVATPTSTTHATTKAYVDSAVTSSKAWSNLTGKPSTFPPTAHVHQVEDVFGLAEKIATTKYNSSVITDTLSYIDGSSTNSGRIVATDSSGRITTVDPISSTHIANKRYVDDTISHSTTWANTSGKPASFPPSAHTHSVANITDLSISTSATANTVVKRDTSGRVNVATPTSSAHAATKTYVDNGIVDAKKWANLTGIPSTFKPSAHSHTMADISNMPDLSTLANPATIAQRDVGGRLVAATPIYTNNVTTKEYVDSKTPWYGTQGQYDGIATKDPDRLYIIAYF